MCVMRKWKYPVDPTSGGRVAMADVNAGAAPWDTAAAVSGTLKARSSCVAALAAAAAAGVPAADFFVVVFAADEWLAWKRSA